MFFLICYIIMSYGLTNLLVYGSGPYNILGEIRIFCYKYLRPIGEMLDCMMCTSTNIGWIISLLNLLLLPNVNITPFNYLINDHSLWYLIIPFDAFFTSGIVWLLHTLQEYMEVKNK